MMMKGKSTSLAMRSLSKAIVAFTHLPIPVLMRKKVFGLFIKIFKVNKDEVLDQNLSNYRSLNEFFTRKINLELRPYDRTTDNILTSPCDGTILSISEIKNFEELIIVKDIKYPLNQFLFGNSVEEFPEYKSWPLKNKKLYQITIYLSPGDCHRYYSPNNIHVTDRIYNPGPLQSVSPKYLRKHERVLLTNERVTLRCNFQQDDLLFITYVGAINVGSVSLVFDDVLKGGKRLKQKKDELINHYAEHVKLTRGEEMGWFNFGSTIVLIFTCDENHNPNFTYKSGEKVRIGKKLFD